MNDRTLTPARVARANLLTLAREHRAIAESWRRAHGLTAEEIAPIVAEHEGIAARIETFAATL